jgi:hypothetical protein
MTDAMRRSWARNLARTFAAAVSVAVVTGGGALSLAIAAAPAGSSTLRGKVASWDRLTPHAYVDAARSDSHRYTWREPSPTVRQEFRKLSANVSRDVCVVAFTSGTPQPHDPVLVKVSGGRITPSTLVVAPGTRLSFKNVDPFPHVLYETGNSQWTPNPTAPGSSREWGATAAGVHVIRDQLFPTVVMNLVVDPAAAEFSLPDHEGGFAMTLPHGEYTLKAFFEGKPVTKEGGTIHIGPAGLEMKEPLVLGGGDSK